MAPGHATSALECGYAETRAPHGGHVSRPRVWVAGARDRGSGCAGTLRLCNCCLESPLSLSLVAIHQGWDQHEMPVRTIRAQSTAPRSGRWLARSVGGRSGGVDVARRQPSGQSGHVRSAKGLAAGALILAISPFLCVCLAIAPADATATAPGVATNVSSVAARAIPPPSGEQAGTLVGPSCVSVSWCLVAGTAAGGIHPYAETIVGPALSAAPCQWWAERNR